MKVDDPILKECRGLAELREKILHARRHCQAYAAELKSAAAPCAKPGIFKKRNLDFVLIQLDRVHHYLVQLEATHVSLGCDLSQSTPCPECGEGA